ncbi:hypothetical protein CEUSTIGMA_g9351.t1 [Chlamydomonas eustigma]|uniref:Hydroxyproline O-arabinosyltransferase-like domain-containing protein n=1 Tax=Chlamydomonas eustigma TaxID=1157962 RepID=A0A250XFT7_9CHLO|nr:hypothetical protein CEUSTIGMA_g9351.t1 [Chlamydomonas eustigma]|eukprot:GAX81923.1 hypothetical protein CEUSTIGMA_g9351.t1 [Chlamydomonas eustigma]
MKSQQGPNSWMILLIVVGFSFSTGYLIGFLGKDVLFTSDPEAALHLDSHGDQAVSRKIQATSPLATVKDDRLSGHSVHTLVTSSGDGYQNFQTRIMYASYKMVQQMPGGEHMTGFTRILHRTVPDILMEEVPTFHVWDVLKPQCDGWCDYPVANRPNAIMQYFRAAAANRSMINGAWILMAECDYVWMAPARAPGDAYDLTVPGWQFYFDYIMPQHADAAPHIQKLLGEGKNIATVPASGPAPAILRFDEWMVIGTDYEKASATMEADEAMKKRLGWVREMYAWDVAVALHPEYKVLTEKPPQSRLMVQPPFDEGMFNASFCHYTWGVLYHEGPPSKGGKQIYRWEKRDFSDIKHVIKPAKLPMPPPYRDGLILEFDAPLTPKRHDLNVLYLTQLNKAIDNLTDLTEYAAKVNAEIIPAFKNSKEDRLTKMAMNNIRYMHWS